MAFWDNPQMVIDHIRHSCVTSDDTGVSEMVIVNDEADITQSKRKKFEDEITDFPDYSQSFDIAASPGVMGRTPKFNHHDKQRRSKQEHQCKTIRWNGQVEKLSEEERFIYFPEKLKDAIVKEQKAKSFVSGLSMLLKETSNASNSFVEYAKFNGNGLENSTKCIEFFLSFLPNEDERLQPFPVTFIDSACVQEVIGLVLYMYIAEGGTYRVQDDIKAYSLHIAEEDGEVDMDFQALDEKEKMSHFGFQHLALVEKYKVNRTDVKDSVDVKIYVAQNGYSVVKFDRTDVKMKAILSKLIKKRGMKMKAGRDYQLEKKGNEGQYVDMESTLQSQETFIFNLVQVKKTDEKEPRFDEKDLQTKTSSTQAEIMSMQYKSYHVMMTHRLLASTEVLLGIHGKSIEIDPVILQKSPKFWSKIKPFSLDVDNIGDCELTEEKSDRSLFRIYYKKTDEFKHYDFETSTKVANEIVSKIHNILKSRSTSARTEFLKKVPLKIKKGRWKT